MNHEELRFGASWNSFSAYFELKGFTRSSTQTERDCCCFGDWNSEFPGLAPLLDSVEEFLEGCDLLLFLWEWWPTISSAKILTARPYRGWMPLIRAKSVVMMLKSKGLKTLRDAYWDDFQIRLDVIKFYFYGATSKKGFKSFKTGPVILILLRFSKRPVDQTV